MRTSIKLTLVLSVASNTAIAAQGLPVGPARAYPEVGLTLQHNDNVTMKNQDEESSMMAILSPRATLEHKQKANTYQGTLGIDIGRYFSTSTDNYEDVQLGGKADWQIDRRASFSLGADYMRGHDPRGSTDRGGISEPSTWNSYGMRGLFGYGMPRARIRLEGELGHTAKRYTDNASEADDKDETELTGRVYYRILPKTHLFVEASDAIINYTLDSSKQDNNRFNLSVGATWRATAKTTGRAKIGYLRKAFDDDSRDDFNGISWQVAVQWKPLSRSTVDIATGRYTADSTGVGDYLVTNDLSVTGTHIWMPRLSSSLGFYFANTDFPTNNAAAGPERSDDTFNFNLAANYELHKMVTVSGGLKFTDRDSNSDTEDYDQRIFFVTLKATY